MNGHKWVGGLLVLVAAAACSSSSGSTAPMGVPGGHSSTILASGSGNNPYGSSGTYYFSPTPDTVAAGTTVTYQFADVAHTVIFDSGPTAMPNISPTENADSTRTFTKAGTYTWHCQIHPYMHGTLVAQ